MFWNKYPYTDFHELNLDWVLKEIKRLIAEWAETKSEWTNTRDEFEELKNYVDTFFEDLDLQAEVNNKLDEMYASGELGTLLSIYTGAIIYSPINFAHMFAYTSNWGNSIGNNAFLGQSVILNDNLGYTCRSTKRTYQMLNGMKYYFYLTTNNNDANMSELFPSTLHIRFYAHDNSTLVYEKEISITELGIKTFSFEVDWDDPLQNTPDNNLEFTYYIELSYNCIITVDLAPTFMVSNFRTSPKVPSSGQCQPLLPVVKNQLPTYTTNYTIEDGSRFDYDAGIIRIAAKFTCVNQSVALVQLASLREAFVVRGLNQFFRCKIYNVTQDREHWLKMEVFGGQPWLSFGDNANRPNVNDELILECCIPWMTQPDMMLYDIEI